MDALLINNKNKSCTFTKFDENTQWTQLHYLSIATTKLFIIRNPSIIDALLISANAFSAFHLNNF